MDAGQRRAVLQQLADEIARRRLGTPARMLLDAIAPLGFLASQIALFARPLTPLGRWHDYVAALADEEGWSVLRGIVDRQDS